MSEETKIETPKDKSLFHNKSAAGKGDRPRNVSKAYWDNWDLINWHKDERKFVVRVDKNTPSEL